MGSRRIGWLAAGLAAVALILLGAFLLLESWRARVSQELARMHGRMLASEALTVATMLPPLQAQQFPERVLERWRQRFDHLAVAVIDSDLSATLISTGHLEPEAVLRLLDRSARSRLVQGQIVDLRIPARGTVPAFRVVALPLPESKSRALVVCDKEPELLDPESPQPFAAGGALALVLALGLALVALLRQPIAHPGHEAGSEAQLVDALGGVVAGLKAKQLDLTRRHEAEHRAAARAQRISASVTDHMPSAAVLLDESGEVHLFNPAAEELFQLEAEATVGRTLDQLPMLRELLGGFVRQCLEAGEPVTRQEIRFLRSDGARCAGLSVSPVVESDGTLHGALCLATDLTEVQALQQQVRLRDRLASLGELSAGLAHELKNAISTIRGFAVLARRESKPELVREYSDAIVSEAESVHVLVEDFLKFARPAALELAPLDLRELLSRCITELAAEPGMAQARFTLRGATPPIEADGGLLRGALLNLLRNAVQAYGGSGREPEVVVESEPVGAERVRIAVRDRGCGIPPAQLDRIFLPFFTTKQHGTGLGLAIVHKVVVTHGGSVTVQSEEGEGTAVLLELPLRPPADPA